jgi:hypothetical protein
MLDEGLRKLQAGDSVGAVRDLTIAADAGDREAAFTLGQIYRLGRGVPVDPRRAVTFYQRAAEAGHTLAQSNLAGLLYFSDAPIRNRPQAIAWWNMAVQAGDPRAQYMLGVLHFNGDELPRDWPRAFGYTLLAQQAGLPEANEAYAEMLKHVSPADQERGRTLMASLAGKPGSEVRPQTVQAPARAAPPKPTQTAAAPPPPRPTPAPAPAAMPAPAPVPTPAPKPAPVASSAPTPPPAPVVVSELPPPPPAAPAPAPAPAPTQAPPPPAPVAVATAPVDAGVWRVQLGTFSTPERAQTHWADVSGKLPAVLQPLAPVYLADGTVTRVQVGSFADRAGAAALCDQIKAGGLSCFLAAPKR